MNNVQMVNIEDFTKYIGLSLLSKGFSVSPLKLQKIYIIHKHGTWCSLEEKTHYLLMSLKHG